MAEDTAGERAAGKFYDRAKATFTTLIDVNHSLSSRYQMVNVPSGVWIDEQGRIVRQSEVAYSKNVAFFSIKIAGDDYVAGLRDWVEKGKKSVFAMGPQDVSRRSTERTPQEDLADVNFKLAVHFHRTGRADLAKKYWSAAQKLSPENWNYHRQDWSFSPGSAGMKWLSKFRNMGDKDYYAPLELPKPGP